MEIEIEIERKACFIDISIEQKLSLKRTIKYINLDNRYITIFCVTKDGDDQINELFRFISFRFKD